MYEPREYRSRVRAPDLVAARVTEGESDLLILSSVDVGAAAARALAACRWQLSEYIAAHPRFASALCPIDVDEGAPGIVLEMAAAARAAGVGPMAAVAGAVAGFVGRRAAPEGADVIVENGGDIYIRSGAPRRVGLFAGDSPLCGRLTLAVAPELTPCGICTSSGTVGHSMSLGRADAAVVIAPSAALADAVATAACNRVQSPGDVGPAAEWVRGVEGAAGALVVMGSAMAAWGCVELVEQPAE